MKLSEIIAPSVDSMRGEDGWTPIEMPFSTTGGASFIEGDPNGQRIRIRQFVREADRRFFARVWYGPLAEGPPKHAHGGSMAAVLDHVMGVGAWVCGHPVLAASITINFHRKLPLGTVVTAEAWVDRVEGRKVYTNGRLYLDDPESPYSSGQGLFIAQELERFKGIIGGEDETLERNIENARANMRL